MIFRSFTHFLGIYLFISEILEKEKCFPARGPASSPQSTASRACGPLSVAGHLGHGLGARPTSRPGQLWRAASKQSAVTATAAGAAARSVAARRWPRWEEVASTSKRGPWGMRPTHGGVPVLTGAASCGHAARRGEGGGVRSAADPGRGGAGLSSAGPGERHERGGGPDTGKWPLAWPGEIKKKEKEMGPAQGNSATF
jgi:hypothetical protein